MFFVAPGAICKRIWVETLLCTGRGTIERRTALADKFGVRFLGLLCDKR